MVLIFKLSNLIFNFQLLNALFLPISKLFPGLFLMCIIVCEVLAPGQRFCKLLCLQGDQVGYLIRFYKSYFTVLGQYLDNLQRYFVLKLKLELDCSFKAYRRFQYSTWKCQNSIFISGSFPESTKSFKRFDRLTRSKPDWLIERYLSVFHFSILFPIIVSL